MLCNLVPICLKTIFYLADHQLLKSKWGEVKCHTTVTKSAPTEATGTHALQLDILLFSRSLPHSASGVAPLASCKKANLPCGTVCCKNRQRLQREIPLSFPDQFQFRSKKVAGVYYTRVQRMSRNVFFLELSKPCPPSMLQSRSGGCVT